jgi:hypothetical protein
VCDRMRAKSNEREVKAFRSEPDIDERGGSEGLVVRTLENGGNIQKRSERNTQ